MRPKSGGVDGQSLLLDDFLSCQGHNPKRVLFVKISPDRGLDDGRLALDPFTASTTEILDRVRKWWELGSYVNDWKAFPNQSPGLLIGLWGRPRQRRVFASLLIDRLRWNEAKHNEECPGLLSVPIVESSDILPDVNTYGFQFRDLTYPNITFGQARSQHFHIHPPV